MLFLTKKHLPLQANFKAKYTNNSIDANDTAVSKERQNLDRGQE
jgi:hypothetical protein